MALSSFTLTQGVADQPVEMPAVGFGVYKIDQPGQCETAVREALEVGYRLIDTAQMYQNEREVGQALKHAFDSGEVSREDVFVTTKLWIKDQGYEAAKAAVDRSRSALGLDTIDMFLIHQPYGDIYGTWRAFEELLSDGVLRAVGVSNFTPDRVVDLCLNTSVVPAVNQIELHPFLQQKQAREIAEEFGVRLQAWAPFARGKNGLFSNEVLGAIAEKHGVGIGQVVIRWLLDSGISAIPKSVHRHRMESNFDVFGFQLDADDQAAIAGLDLETSFFKDPRDPQAVKDLCARDAQLARAC